MRRRPKLECSFEKADSRPQYLTTGAGFGHYIARPSFASLLQADVQGKRRDFFTADDSIQSITEDKLNKMSQGVAYTALQRKMKLQVSPTVRARREPKRGEMPSLGKAAAEKEVVAQALKDMADARNAKLLGHQESSPEMSTKPSMSSRPVPGGNPDRRTPRVSLWSFTSRRSGNSTRKNIIFTDLRRLEARSGYQQPRSDLERGFGRSATGW